MSVATRRFFLLFSALLFSAVPLVRANAQSPLSNAVILIIRHAEKPLVGNDLTTDGYARAQAYVKYFETFKVDGVVRRPDYIIAAADTKGSMRPRLTVTPLAQALNLQINTDYKVKAPEDLIQALKTQTFGKTILIAWHHEAIADLLTQLGADPNVLLPDGKWPSSVYGWVIELRYDAQGNLVPSKSVRISEHLMPNDSD